MYHIILNVFGDRSYAMRKFKRMMYWYPKFRYANPYPIPYPTPKDPTEQARLALERMCPDIKKQITVVQVQYHHTTIIEFVGAVPKRDFLELEFIIFQAAEVDEHAEDATWIASLTCPDQRELIANHPDERPLYVEGEFSVHLREAWLKYFVLRDEPKEMIEAGPLLNPKPYYEIDSEIFSIYLKFKDSFPDYRSYVIVNFINTGQFSLVIICRCVFSKLQLGSIFPKGKPERICTTVFSPRARRREHLIDVYYRNWKQTLFEVLDRIPYKDKPKACTGTYRV